MLLSVSHIDLQLYEFKDIYKKTTIIFMFGRVDRPRPVSDCDPGYVFLCWELSFILHIYLIEMKTIVFYQKMKKRNVIFNFRKDQGAGSQEPVAR